MSPQLTIGDLHGCFMATETITPFIGFRFNDTVIALRDYVNRGRGAHAVLGVN